MFGSNPAVSAPRAGHIEKRLDSLDFLMVSDFFLSETAERADVVLPSAQWAEEEGTMTNLEGRVLLRRRVTSPPEGVRTDLEMISALAQRLGVPQSFPLAAGTKMFDELRRASGGRRRRLFRNYVMSGFCVRMVFSGHVRWHPGTPRLFLDRFATEDGRARFHAVEFRPAAEEPDHDFPLYLTTGRIMAQYQSGTQTRQIPALMQASPRAFVQIHPQWRVRTASAEGDDVRLTTRRGTALLIAQLTSTIRMDTLFVPFHFSGAGRANLLTNPALDPVSRMPEFKVCAARIEKGNPC